MTARCFSRFNFPFNVKKKISTAQQPPGPGGVVGVAVGGPGQAAGSGAGQSGVGGAGTSGQGAGGPVHGFVSGAAGGTHQSEYL